MLLGGYYCIILGGYNLGDIMKMMMMVMWIGV